jgi:hypothetical protein
VTSLNADDDRSDRILGGWPILTPSINFEGAPSGARTPSAAKAEGVAGFDGTAEAVPSHFLPLPILESIAAGPRGSDESV